MNGSERLRKLNRLGRDRGVQVRIDTEQGKGSHATVYVGERFTVIKGRRKEIGTWSAALDVAATRPYRTRSELKGRAMSGMRYLYPVRLEADEIGRLVVHFPDLPEALTDGADAEEALAEASDCLSEALAGRIHRQEDIPIPSPLRRGMYAVEPEPTIALKAALYEALTARGMSRAGLGQRLGIDDRQAARLIDPRARTPLSKLEEALLALGYTIGIEVREKRVA